MTITLWADSGCRKLPVLINKANEAADQSKRAAAQKRREFIEKFAEIDKVETGQFWSCAMASEVDIGTFARMEQFEKRLAAAHLARQESFATYLTDECVPKLERARTAVSGLRDPPTELAGPLAQYRASLGKLRSGLQDYARGLGNPGPGKNADQLRKSRMRDDNAESLLLAANDYMAARAAFAQAAR